MGKTLYLECTAGISGDMAVAALLDLGASEERLRKALTSLPVDGFEVRISRVSKAGLDACDFDVVLDPAHENHDHDMAYLHGCEEHRADCDHAAARHAHRHEHRGLAEIEAIIQSAAISDRAKEIALRIFGVIARAEAKAHGTAIDQVHFHEVGAVDSIVDAVAFAVCFDDLGIDDVVVERLSEGRGTVRCQHGVLPVPVPAVVNIVSEAGIPLSIMDAQGEFVTPTGAAIVAAVRTRPSLPERFSVVRVGMGAGKRGYAIPGILRAMVIEEPAGPSPVSDRVWKLECDVDDCTGEALGFAMERLFAAGAREAHFVPVYMKKGRPAYQIQVICLQEDIRAIEEELFAHTTTIGVRRAPMERSVLLREELVVDTPFGAARAKRVVLPNGEARVMPEHDDVISLVEASSSGIAANEADSSVCLPLSYGAAYRLVQHAVEDGCLGVAG